MRGAVVWATVISLLLGCVIGIAVMGTFLLPIQFKLEQEQIGLREEARMMEEQRNDALARAENAEAIQKRAEAAALQLAKEKRQLELQFADAKRLLAEEQRKQLKKP